MGKQPVERLLGQPVQKFVADSSKRSPRHFDSYRPQMVRLPAVNRTGTYGPVRVDRTIKLLPVGGISITFRVPFSVKEIPDLVGYHDLQFEDSSLYNEVRELAEQVRLELAPYYVRPVPKLLDEEAYTVFCIESPLSQRDTAGVVSAEAWLEEHRREVASLLTQEPDLSKLSNQEALESTSRSLSYYRNDLTVIDWDAALIMDERSGFEDTLHIMELANFQLAELEAFDRILDDSLERCYRDVRAKPIRSRLDVLGELRELRIDLARFSDELSNITKFFGDWHLARIYEHLAARFHLSDWHRTLDEKLKTLDDLYQFLSQDRTNRWMLILEATIVLLFIIDLVVLFMGLQKP